MFPDPSSNGDATFTPVDDEETLPTGNPSRPGPASMTDNPFVGMYDASPPVPAAHDGGQPATIPNPCARPSVTEEGFLQFLQRGMRPMPAQQKAKMLKRLTIGTLGRLDDMLVGTAQAPGPGEVMYSGPSEVDRIMNIAGLPQTVVQAVGGTLGEMRAEVECKPPKEVKKTGDQISNIIGLAFAVKGILKGFKSMTSTDPREAFNGLLQNRKAMTEGIKSTTEISDYDKKHQGIVAPGTPVVQPRK